MPSIIFSINFRVNLRLINKDIEMLYETPSNRISNRRDSNSPTNGELAFRSSNHRKINSRVDNSRLVSKADSKVDNNSLPAISHDRLEQELVRRVPMPKNVLTHVEIQRKPSRLCLKWKMQLTR